MRTKNSTSVAAFKANLWNFHNIKGAMHKHRLFYGDTELDDDLLPLHYYGINNGSILQLGKRKISKSKSSASAWGSFPLILLFPWPCFRLFVCMIKITLLQFYHVPKFLIAVGESVIKVTVINSRNQYGFVKMRLSETILDLKQKLSHSMKSIHVDMMLLFLKVDEGTFGIPITAS